MKKIPDNYVNYKSTTVFDKQNVPKMFLHQHNTRAGVYGKIGVISGKLKFFGFTGRPGDVEIEEIIEAGDFLFSPPEYWHKVEFLTDETKFKVDFFAEEESAIVKQHLSERKD